MRYTHTHTHTAHTRYDLSYHAHMLHPACTQEAHDTLPPETIFSRTCRFHILLIATNQAGAVSVHDQSNNFRIGML